MGSWRLDLEVQHEPVCVYCCELHEREVMRDDGDLLHQLGRQQPEGGVGMGVEQTGGGQEEEEEQQGLWLLAPSH